VIFAHIIADLRASADRICTQAAEDRETAVRHETAAETCRQLAELRDELARTYSLVADALGTGRITRDQLREIVNVEMLNDEPDAYWADRQWWNGEARTKDEDRDAEHENRNRDEARGFDAIIKELRNGANTRLARARECRAAATHYQAKALAATTQAATHEEFAQGLDLLADALSSGALTVGQLREIVAAVNTGEAPARGFEVDDVVNVSDVESPDFGKRGTVVSTWTNDSITVNFGSGTWSFRASQLMHHAAFVAQMDAAEQQAAKDAEAADDAMSASERFEHDRDDEFRIDAEDDARWGAAQDGSPF